MSCALPVITSKAGTMDLVDDGVNAIRSARWVFCFAKHIKELYNDAALRERLGVQARKDIQKYDWKNVAENILAHLENN